MICSCSDTSEHMISCENHPRNKNISESPDLFAYHVLVKIDTSTPNSDGAIKHHFFVRAADEGQAIIAVKSTWHCEDGAMPEMQFVVNAAARREVLGAPIHKNVPKSAEVYSL